MFTRNKITQNYTVCQHFFKKICFRIAAPPAAARTVRNRCSSFAFGSLSQGCYRMARTIASIGGYAAVSPGYVRKWRDTSSNDSHTFAALYSNACCTYGYFRCKILIYRFARQVRHRIWSM